MDGYFSYYSAALLWDIPFIEVILGCNTKEIYSTHITVAKQNSRFRYNDRKVHSCELALPEGAVTTRNGVKVASPELLFLQLGLKLNIHQLILLGLQLCSHPPGFPSMAITTKQKINTFLSKTSGHLGQRKALRALKHLENGSASIMESLVYMILTLPNELGGYGLKGAVFNQEIRLKTEARTRLGQSRCFADLYYKQPKVAVEYESFAYHNNPSEQGKDFMRSAILERQGINVMHLTTIQLYDNDACRDFAYNLAERIGKRIRICTKKFNEMHSQIRALLPAGESE
jgi:very-short-patch-repair endonuclease